MEQNETLNADNLGVQSASLPSDTLSKVKSNKKLKVTLIILGVFMFVLVTIVAYAVFFIKPLIKNTKDSVTDPVITVDTSEPEKPSEQKIAEKDFEGINPVSQEVIVKQPSVVIEKAPAVIEKQVSIPANNKKPEVSILSYGLTDYTHANDKGISISVRAKDADGYISKVEVYIDDEKEATVLPRNIGGKSKTLLDDPEDIFDITETIGNSIKEEVDDGNIGYVYRDSKEWTKASESCGISVGFVHIFVGESKYYDVRTSKDVENSVICYDGKTINVEDLYYYMWQPESGEHSVYAIAYDQYDAKTKSETFNIEVD